MKYFLDLDGVFADLYGAVKRAGIDFKPFQYTKPFNELSPEEQSLDIQVRDLWKTPGFWKDIDLLPGSYALWDYLRGYNPYILTARPKDDSIAHQVTKEKLEWVTEKFGKDQADRTIICVRHEKPAWASDSGIPNILVDDLLQNCEEWEQSGGKAFHYKGFVSDTIGEINNWKFSATR